MKNSFILSAIIFLLAISGSAYAGDKQDKARRLTESGEILSLEVILEKARKIHPGKVIEVEFETKKDKNIYEIEILGTNGTVFELKMDAQSGRLISNKKED